MQAVRRFLDRLGFNRETPLVPLLNHAFSYPASHQYRASWGFCTATGTTPRVAIWNVIVFRLLRHHERVFDRLIRW